jgi:integrase
LDEAETVGLPWDSGDEVSAHVPKTSRRTVYSTTTIAAVRLLIFTGCRLLEILHARWDWVDTEHSSLVLPDSKTGRRSVPLNAPALAVLETLPRNGPFLFPGPKSKGRKPVADSVLGMQFVGKLG